MTKAKTTKRALLMSVLSMLLCLSMLVGSTFAWFTDTVTSGNNKIVAGNLDVELLMKASADGDYENITAESAPIFGSGSIAQNNNAETLWEPGKTQVAYLAIQNNGTLALKYKVGLDVKNVSKNLYEVMQYDITPDAQYGEVKAWAGNGKSVVPGTQLVSEADVFLGVGETHYFALSIHMGEEAGNEYMDGEVDFDLTVLATQATYESDSFGKDYDAGAEYDEAAAYPTTIADGLYYDDVDTYYVTNANGLTAMTNKIDEVAEYEAHIFKGKTVKLTRNIDLGGAEWLPIGGFGLTSKQFDGTFDGQGYTVSNFKITKRNMDREGKNRSSHGLFGNVSGTIKNLTVKDVTVDLKDAANGNPVAALVGRLNKGGLIENCHVVNSNLTTNDWQIGGLVGQNNAGNIKRCSVVNTTVTGQSAVGALVGIRLAEGESTIEKCSVNGCTLAMNDPYGGIYDEMFGVVLGTAFKDATVNVKACTIESTTIKGAASSVVCGYIETGATVNITD